MSKQDCVFCKIVEGEIPARKLSEGRYTLAILDANPASLGHTLIITKQHHEDITTMSVEEMKEVGEQQLMLIPAIMTVTACSGANLLCNIGEGAGQVVGHAHFHILPRFEDDDIQVKLGQFELADEERDELAEQIRDNI